MKLGMDVTSEGAEEVLTEVVSAVGRKLTYLSEKEWKEILTVEDIWDTFVGGAIMGGGFSGFDTVKSNMQGVDPASKLTKAEENDVNKLYEEKIAEAKANGKKLTSSDKNKLYNSLKQQITGDAIDTDNVNEPTGAEDYKTYKDVENNGIRQKNASEAENGALENTPIQQGATKQGERPVETKRQLDNLNNNSLNENLLKSVKDGTEKFKIAGETTLDKWNERFKRGAFAEDSNNTKRSEEGFERSLSVDKENTDEKREGYNNYINPEMFIDGLWEGSRNSEYNEKAKDVEKSQLESVENIDENGIIELTLDNITKDILKTKPPYSPRPKRWIKNGGSVLIDKNGNWIYTDSNGITVKYVDGYPDFESAGTVAQKVNIGGFKNRTSDVRKANALAPNGPCKKGYVWHHSQDGQSMMQISEEIHKKFTHRGGYSLMKMKRRK